ncbi:MAG: DinB family protein [Acidobacteriia bacterium]|nr:DinB family protein [Terriglobia bacterium]
MMTVHTAPKENEYAPYFGRYISLIASDDIVATLESQIAGTAVLLAGLAPQDGHYRYAPEKWTVNEALGHIIDTERIFAYRALRIARNDPTPLPSFEQDDYVKYGPHASCRLPDLLEEFRCIRRSSLFLFQNLQPEAWTRIGTAGQNPISVRAIAWIIAGHEVHHAKILRESYLPNLAAR